MATIKDVAQAAQVSAAAVSRVLNKDDSISVSPEVRTRIFQAAHTLGYVSPRQRRAAEHKTHLVIGVADWRIVRPDRQNVRLASLSCLVQMMTDRYDVSFTRLDFGQPQKVDGVIALSACTPEEIDFLRSLSFAIVFVNSGQSSYEFDQVQVDFKKGQEQMTEYLLDRKQYKSLGYIGGIYEGQNWRIGVNRLEGLKGILSARNAYDERFFHIGEISRESGYALAKHAVETGALPKPSCSAATRSLRARSRPFESSASGSRKTLQSSFTTIYRRWRASGPPAPVSRCTLTTSGKARSTCSSAG